MRSSLLSGGVKVEFQINIDAVLKTNMHNQYCSLYRAYVKIRLIFTWPITMKNKNTHRVMEKYPCNSALGFNLKS